MDYNNNNYNYNYDYNQVDNFYENKPGSGFAVTSLVLGIVSLVCCCGGTCTAFFPMGSILSIIAIVVVFVCALLAVIFGIVGLAKHQNKAMSIIGLILGVLGIVLGVAIIILSVLGFIGIMAAALSDYNSSSGYYY